MASIWGALEGLGTSLNEIGTAQFKSQLADKLEQQREARADERAKAKELRDAQKETGTKLVRDSEGVTWVQGVNSAGRDVGAPTLASAQDIKNYNQEEKDKQTKMSLDSLKLLGAERDAADYEEDKSLERAAKQAQIDQMKDASARGWAGLAIQRQEANDRRAGVGGYARGGSSSGGLADSMSTNFNSADYVEEFLGTDMGKALYKDYVESGRLSGEKFLEQVNGSILQAKNQRRDAVPMIRSALRGAAAGK